MCTSSREGCSRPSISTKRQTKHKPGRTSFYFQNSSLDHFIFWSIGGKYRPRIDFANIHKSLLKWIKAILKKFKEWPTCPHGCFAWQAFRQCWDLLLTETGFGPVATLKSSYQAQHDVMNFHWYLLTVATQQQEPHLVWGQSHPQTWNEMLLLLLMQPLPWLASTAQHSTST